jgi:transposase-like protein
MPAHWRWAVIRRRQEWFRYAERKGVTRTCRAFGISRRTYYKWWNRFQAAHGDPQVLQDRSRRPKTHPKTAPEKVVKAVLQLRKKTDYGPRRIQYYLREDHQIRWSVCGIYKILNREGLIKHYARKRKKYQSYAAYIRYPGQKVQIDVKYVPRPKGQDRDRQLFQYQAKDLFTKTRFFRVYDELSAHNTVDFAERCQRFFPFPIKRLQTDHGIEFTYVFLDAHREHPLDTFCRQHAIQHTLIPVATPRYNGQVERANRTDMEEFYRRADWTERKDLIPKMGRYLRYTNTHRPHMAIDMLTPLQKLRSVKGYENANLDYGCYP